MSAVSAEQCALNIERLTRDPRFSTRAEDLGSLAEDLSNPEGDRWAGTDLLAAFPSDSTIRLTHSNSVERLLGVLAGVSVFLPVGWTWWGFHDASAAYERLIAESGEPEGRTFLGLWVSGFEGRLDGLHRLVPMAMVSLSLIIAAMTFLVLHRLSAGRNVRTEEYEARVARAELTTWLTRAQLILNERRADHPLRIQGIVKSSMKKLRDAHEATRVAARELQLTAEGVGKGVDDLLASAESARAESEALLRQARSSHDSLEAAVQRTGTVVSDSIAALYTAVQSGVETTQTAMSSSSRELSQELSRSLGQFEEALGDQVDSLRQDSVTAIGQAGMSLMGVVDQIGGSAERNAAAAGVLTEQVSALADDIALTREELSGALRDIRSTLADDNALTREELSGAVSEIRSTLEAIETALIRHESALQGQAGELTAARDAAERMLRHLTIRLTSATEPGDTRTEMSA